VGADKLARCELGLGKVGLGKLGSRMCGIFYAKLLPPIYSIVH